MRRRRRGLISETVTIAVATYNGEQHLAHALESAIATGARVIVSDDASSDSSIEIARALVPDVDLFTHSENSGIQGNYEFLLSQCDTPLALFLNQDDVLRPERLGGLRPSLNHVTVINGWVIDDRGRQQGLIYRRPPYHPLVRGVYPALCRKGFFKSPSQAMFPVQAARDVGGFLIPGAQGQGAEDWMCWLRLASAGVPFCLHMEPRMGYRVHANNYHIALGGSHFESKEAVRRVMPKPPARNRRLAVRW